MRILVVEDDKDLQRLLKKSLSEAGYVVDVAADGEEGHFLGDTEPYDAVVLDLGLPKKDGLSVLERWRRDERKMPVLILTARERWSDKVAGMDAGADDYVAKPFHMEEVLARIRALPGGSASASGPRAMRFSPLAFRLFAAAAAWTLVVPPVPAILLVSLYREAVERNCDARLNVYLTSLVASTTEGSGAKPKEPANL